MQKNICAIHGELSESNAYVCKEKSSKDGVRLRCKACCADRRKQQYYKNRDKAIQQAGKWKKANREHVNAQARENYQLNLASSRRKEAVRKKKLALSKYYEMLEEHNHACAICKLPEKRRNRSDGGIAELCIDHCHKTNHIRGLLCHDCNTGIGKFEDSIEYLHSAIRYLQKAEQQIQFTQT